VSAAKEKLPLTSVANRQLKKFYAMHASAAFQLLQSYGSQIMVPTEQGQIYSELISGLIN
jgi:hypothetical protein